MYIIKRNGEKQEFNPDKINKAIMAAAKACGKDWYEYDRSTLISVLNGDSTTDIRIKIENWLMFTDPDVAREFILYPYKNNK